MSFKNNPDDYSSYSDYIKDWYKSVVDPLYVKRLSNTELEGMTKESLIFLIEQIYDKNADIQHYFNNTMDVLQEHIAYAEKAVDKLHTYKRYFKTDKNNTIANDIANLAMGGLSGFAGAAFYDAIADDSDSFDCNDVDCSF